MTMCAPGSKQCQGRALEQGLPWAKIGKGKLHCHGAFPSLLQANWIYSLGIHINACKKILHRTVVVLRDKTIQGLSLHRTALPIKPVLKSKSVLQQSSKIIEFSNLKQEKPPRSPSPTLNEHNHTHYSHAHVTIISLQDGHRETYSTDRFSKLFYPALQIVFFGILKSFKSVEIIFSAFFICNSVSNAQIEVSCASKGLCPCGNPVFMWKSCPPCICLFSENFYILINFQLFC